MEANATAALSTPAPRANASTRKWLECQPTVGLSRTGCELSKHPLALPPDHLVTHLRALIEGSDAWPPRHRDELVGSLKNKPGLRRYLRRTGSGMLRTDATAIERESHLDGKWLIAGSVGERPPIACPFPPQIAGDEQLLVQGGFDLYTHRAAGDGS